MNNVVNLNQFRKQKARADKEQHAAENREKFGRTKAEKTEAENKVRQRDDHLDRHALQDPEAGNNAQKDDD